VTAAALLLGEKDMVRKCTKSQHTAGVGKKYQSPQKKKQPKKKKKKNPNKKG